MRSIIDNIQSQLTLFRLVGYVGSKKFTRVSASLPLACVMHGVVVSPLREYFIRLIGAAQP